MHLIAASHSVVFDVVLMAHIGIGLASLVLFIVSYSAARQLPMASKTAQQYFGPGAQWPLRIIHLLPLTGIVLVITSRHAIAFSEPFVGIGLALWLAMSAVLEAMVMPSITKTSAALLKGATPDFGLLRRIKVGLDVAAVLLVVAAVIMVAQPGS